MPEALRCICCSVVLNFSMVVKTNVNNNNNNWHAWMTLNCHHNNIDTYDNTLTNMFVCTCFQFANKQVPMHAFMYIHPYDFVILSISHLYVKQKANMEWVGVGIGTCAVPHIIIHTWSSCSLYLAFLLYACRKKLWTVITIFHACLGSIAAARRLPPRWLISTCSTMFMHT